MSHSYFQERTENDSQYKEDAEDKFQEMADDLFRRQEEAYMNDNRRTKIFFSLVFVLTATLLCYFIYFFTLLKLYKNSDENYKAIIHPLLYETFNSHYTCHVFILYHTLYSCVLCTFFFRRTRLRVLYTVVNISLFIALQDMFGLGEIWMVIGLMVIGQFLKGRYDLIA